MSQSVTILKNLDLSSPLPAGDVIRVEHWSGNQRPFRATAWRDGRLLGATGGCSTPTRAIDAAMPLLAK